MYAVPQGVEGTLKWQYLKRQINLPSVHFIDICNRLLDLDFFLQVMSSNEIVVIFVKYLFRQGEV